MIWDNNVYIYIHISKVEAWDWEEAGEREENQSKVREKRLKNEKYLNEIFELKISQISKILQKKEKLCETFDQLDINQDGRLSRNEIAVLWKLMNVEPTRMELDFIFQEMDPN
ncbi:hypothetical protein LOAG_13193, partial [Loa loa]